MKKNIYSKLLPKDYNELKTIKDMANHCSKLAAQFNFGLDKDKREHLASGIFGIIFSDHFQELLKQYPILEDIDHMSGSLEWSNCMDSNCDSDWLELLQYIAELERQAKNA